MEAVEERKKEGKEEMKEDKKDGKKEEQELRNNEKQWDAMKGSGRERGRDEGTGS